MTDYIDHKDDISLIDLYKVLWSKKYYIFLSAFLISILCFFYAKNIEDMYQSRALLAPSSESDSSSSMGMLSGVASIAGINVPSNSSANKVLISIERLQSLDFFVKVIDKHNLYFDIVAVNSWNSDTNTVEVDPDIYDDKKNIWVSEGKFAVNGRPSAQDTHLQFLDNFSINHDIKTGFVSLSYKHYSPHIAKKIIEIFVTEINETIRVEDISTAEHMIAYLENESLKTKNIDLRLGINSLIQSQIKKVAIADSTPQYVLKVISPPFSPETRFSPSRLSIIIVGFIIGLIFSSMFFILTKIYTDDKIST